MSAPISVLIPAQVKSGAAASREAEVNKSKTTGGSNFNQDDHSFKMSDQKTQLSLQLQAHCHSFGNEEETPIEADQRQQV